jgi:hypothetical protein
MTTSDKIKKDVSVVLLHEDMHDKQGKVVTTSLTLIDVHDIARSSRTFGATNCFIAHPSPTLQRLSRTLKTHWESGFGATYNPNLDDAISKIHLRTGKLPTLVATSGRRGPGKLSFTDMRNKIEASEDPFLIMIGTGWGMRPELFARANIFLGPIEGTETYNFLSCRSATAIILDRLLGLR